MQNLMTIIKAVKQGVDFLVVHHGLLLGLERGH